MRLGSLEADAGMQEKARHRTAVLIVYKNRLFRDIVAGVLAKAPGIGAVETTRGGENGLRLIEDQNARRIVVIVETEGHINMDRGTLTFFLRATEHDPRVRVMAVTLGGSGISFRSWRWLRHLNSEYLVREVLRD